MNYDCLCEVKTEVLSWCYDAAKPCRQEVGVGDCMHKVSDTGDHCSHQVFSQQSALVSFHRRTLNKLD